MTTESERIVARLRAAIRDEVSRQIRAMSNAGKLPRARHCGRGNAIPQCMGSAARGWEHCTCPGVPVEYYR